jgi:hypothetical protein
MNISSCGVFFNNNLNFSKFPTYSYETAISVPKVQSWRLFPHVHFTWHDTTSWCTCSLQREEVRVSEKLIVSLLYFHFSHLMCSVQSYIHSLPTLLACSFCSIHRLITETHDELGLCNREGVHYKSITCELDHLKPYIIKKVNAPSNLS